MALLSRVKVWIAGETLTASDLNAEFNNIINNLDPDGIEDASATNGAMQAIRDPYAGDVIVLATSLREELQGIRFVLDEMHGGTFWYVSKELLGLSGGTMTGALVLPAGSAAAPAVGWTDTGFYEISADKIGVAVNGALVFSIDSTGFLANTATGPGVLDEAATSTNPTLVPNRGDIDTGIGWATDTVHIIVNGASVFSVTTAGAALVGDLTVTASAASPPDANTVVKDNIIKFWANFNGTGTPAYRDSYNTTGAITDNGTGDYTLLVNTNFASVNFSLAGTHNNTGVPSIRISAMAVGSIRIETLNGDGSAVLVDPSIVTLIAIGDQ